jgi:hypothetical protein
LERPDVLFQRRNRQILTPRRGGVENVCAENTDEYYKNGFTKVPQSNKPDF